MPAAWTSEPAPHLVEERLGELEGPVQQRLPYDGADAAVIKARICAHDFVDQCPLPSPPLTCEIPPTRRR